MKTDVSIVNGYLHGETDYSHHWIYSTIREDGKYAFESPDPACRERVKSLAAEIEECFNSFVPYNISIFGTLFPHWKRSMDNVHVILAVGCPPPYDAMTREHNGERYMIFDLIRFLDYRMESGGIVSMIFQLIMHEFTHICLYGDYPPVVQGYADALKYIAFDEGFAHLLAMRDIFSFDFSPMIKLHYKAAIEEFKRALRETDAKKQKKYLEEANSGPYWDKFAAISGKLYLAAHLESLKEIYRSGPDRMASDMGLVCPT